MSVESVVLKVINKINTELKLVYRKNKVLTQELCRMLCNGLFQLHFDYACPAWYPNLNKEKKWNIQIMPKTSIQFCLRLEYISY